MTSEDGPPEAIFDCPVGATGTPEQLAMEAVEAGISAGQPGTVIAEAVERNGEDLRVAGCTYDLSAYEEVVLLGGGNAAGRIVASLATELEEVVTAGVVVTDDPVPLEEIPVDVVEGTHPLPSARNERGTRRLLEQARACDADTLVLVAMSGGGSALLTAPVESVPIAAYRTLTDRLLQSGAPIAAINTVRKHLSDVKGGRLGQVLSPATCAALVFSDVTSGDPAVVASGPLSGDNTTYNDALEILERYHVDAPEAVRQYLLAGAAGDVSETPTAADPAFETVSVHALADGFTALAAAADVCEEAGFEPLILSASVRGEAREAAKTHVAIAEEIQRTGNPVDPPAAVLSGGETTVTVRASGTGGPNQEFAVSAALELPEGVVLAAADTDGIDGPTDAAGAIVTDELMADARRSARTALETNDVNEFLGTRDALLVSGQTGTNVNDLRVLVVPDNS